MAMMTAIVVAVFCFAVVLCLSAGPEVETLTCTATVVNEVYHHVCQ